jgi:hypothetical protein
MTRRIALVSALAFSTGGCIAGHPAPPQQTISVSNPAYKVDLLFKDPNGASIYRFYDQDDYRYYIVGPDGAHMLPTTHTVDNSTTDTEIVDVDSGSHRDHGGDHGGGGGGGHHH